jgi:filamentous hemagglutinin
VQSGQDIKVSGSDIASSQGTALDAARNVSIEAATNTHNETHLEQKRTSGLMSSGGFGLTIGTRSLSTHSDTTTSTASAATIGSTQGDVTIKAGDKVTQTGSNVIAPQGDVTIAARKVDIVEARNHQTTVTETQFKQSGLTVAVANPIVTTVQTAQAMGQAASNTTDPRMKALAAANTAMAAKNAVDAVIAGQGRTLNGKADQIGTGTDAAGNASSRDANVVDKLGGIQLSMSVGSAKSDSRTVVRTSDAVASSVSAGGYVRITAEGDKAHSDLTVQGSQITAGAQVNLVAEHALTLQAADNTETQTGTSSSSSASVGLILDSKGGLGVNASASQGRGNASGQDQRWTNATVNAGQQVVLQSGANTTLKGGVVSAPEVTVAAGGKLDIESLQDTSTYTSRQKQLGGSATLGTAPSANVNAAKSNIDSTYTSVTEQSGMKAGDGGFDIRVAGDTTLKGGVISSTQAAVDAKRNQFSSGGQVAATDIENHAHYQAESVSVNLGAGFSAQGKLAPSGTGVGFGKDSDSAASITHAGISGMAGNPGLSGTANGSGNPTNLGDATVRTGDKAAGIAKIFDVDKVQKEVAAQTQITQMFSTLAPKAVATYADGQIRELQKHQSETTDPSKRDELQQQIDYWADGGRYRVALHTTVGGLNGGVAGASGAGVSAALTPQVASAIDKAELPASAKSALVASTATLIGGAVGGQQGAGAALSETTNNFLSHQEARQRAAATERLLECKDDACRSQARTEINRIDALDKWRDQQVSDACRLPASDLCKGWYAALADAKQSYQVGYVARDDVSQSIASERRQVNEQEFLYRQRINNPFAFGIAKGLMKLTPPALVVGVGLTTYEVTAAVMEVGAVDAALAIAIGLRDLPREIKARLNSEDPTVRGEALVDTLAIAGASTAIVGRLQQTGSKAFTAALEKQAALQAEARAVANAQVENNVYRDGHRFESNVIDGVPLANIRLEYETAIRNILADAKKMLLAGQSEETVARWAVEMRNDIKLQFHEKTPPKRLSIIESRNIEKYKHHVGPTLDELHESGKSWMQIIESSARPGGRDIDLSPIWPEK